MDIHLIPLDYFEIIVLLWLFVKAYYDGRVFRELTRDCGEMKDDIERFRRQIYMDELMIEKLKSEIEKLKGDASA